MIRDDDSIDVQSATIGSGNNTYHVSSVSGLKFVDGRIEGRVDEYSTIDGNSISSDANFVYDKENQVLEVTKPEESAEDYQINMQFLSEGVTLKGNNIVF